MKKEKEEKTKKEEKKLVSISASWGPPLAGLGMDRQPKATTQAVSEMPLAHVRVIRTGL